jgi:hypothetical protein
MRNVLTTLVVVVMVATSFAALAEAAGATIPTGPVTGTGGAVLFSGGTRINCGTSSFTATFRNPMTPPLIVANDLQLRFATCTRLGGIVLTVACTNRAVLTATGASVSGVTPASLTGINCVFSVTGGCSAALSGGVTGFFTNASSSLTINTTGQTLAFSGSTCTSTLPNGATTFTNSTGGAAVYRVNPPTIWP